MWAGLRVHTLGPPKDLWFTLGQTEFEFMPRFETSSTPKGERAITFRVINIETADTSPQTSNTVELPGVISRAIK
jgi:hypothetical protein